MYKNDIFNRLNDESTLSDEQMFDMNRSIARDLNKKYKALVLKKKLTLESDDLAIVTLYLALSSRDKKALELLHEQGRVEISENISSLKNSNQIFFINRLGIVLYKVNIKIPVRETANKKIHHLVSITYDFSSFPAKRIIYSIISKIFRGYNYTGKFGKILHPTSDLSIYFRQSAANTLYITIRDRKVTDSPLEQFKLNFAWLISHILRVVWKPTLMYEKHTSRFEESAAIVFRKLISKNFRNVYFIMSDDNEMYNKIKDSYGNKILKKYTLKHYLAFFCCDSFIGTESLVHSVDLRTANKHVLRKISSKKIKFVFLQHGVMYMVSLSSDTRKGFRYKGGLLPDNSRIVVSSLKEAEHFIVQGGYPPHMLYLSGLPKFDIATRKNNANRIVVMPTWRPWEFNHIRINPEDTGYYKMMKSIVDSVPKELLSTVVLLPHPLFKGAIQQTELGKYCDETLSYDEILSETELLITDYSSISYDAFYRGANIIFWWKDKNKCMEEYGGELMLNNDNVFGDVVNSKKSLSSAIEDNYKTPQSKKYKNRYQKIVEFSDNKNTDRLISFLKQDGII